MDLLNDVADMIIKLLPSTIRDGEVASVSLGSYSREREMDELLDKYGGNAGMADGLRHLAHVSIYVDNKHPSSAKGVYSHQSNFRTADLIVYCKTGANEADWGKPVSTSAAKANGGIQISLKATLVHELRHHFQRFAYPAYYKEKIDHDNYHSNPIEIDAAWFHHLDEFAVGDYATAKDYADAVMKAFVAYKRIPASSPWVRHYYKKTARFWLDRSQPTAPEKSLADRAVDRKRKVAEAMAAMMPDPSHDIDMRTTIPGYNPDQQNFFLPGRMIASCCTAVKQTTINASNGNAFIILLMFALGNRADLSKARTFVEKVSGISFAEAAANNPFPDTYDKSAMTKFVRSSFEF